MTVTQYSRWIAPLFSTLPSVYSFESNPALVSCSSHTFYAFHCIECTYCRLTRHYIILKGIFTVQNKTANECYIRLLSSMYCVLTAVEFGVVIESVESAVPIGRGFLFGGAVKL